MTRKKATNKIRKITGRKDMYITGSRGEWYVDSTETDYLERRVKGRKTLVELVQYVTDAVSVDAFNR